VTAPRPWPRAALGALLICALTLPLLSGCTWFNRVLHRGGKTTGCSERPFAGNADFRPPLKVPEGLSAPDTRSAVKIPELGPNARERPRTEPCLAQPPDFFAKPLQPAKGKSAAPGASGNCPGCTHAAATRDRADRAARAGATVRTGGGAAGATWVGAVPGRLLEFFQPVFRGLQPASAALTTSLKI
jgi:hypothetical protein